MSYEPVPGEHPFGPEFSPCRKPADLLGAEYRPSYHFNPDIPVRVVGALDKAVKAIPEERDEALSKFMADLNKPNPVFFRYKQDSDHRAQSPALQEDYLRFPFKLC